MVLVYEKTGEIVKIGDRVKTFRGEDVEVLKIVEPTHDASTGRVALEFVGKGWKQYYYPGVIGATWTYERTNI